MMKHWKPVRNVILKKVQDECFLLNRADGHVHSVSETGALIWEMLMESIGTEAMIERMIQEYEVDRETALSDVQEFLTSLNRKGLVTELEE